MLGSVASADKESSSFLAGGLGRVCSEIVGRLGPNGRSAFEFLAAAGCERQVLGAVIGPSVAFWDEKEKPSAFAAWSNIIAMAALWAAVKAPRSGPVRAQVDRMRAVLASPLAMAMQAGVLAEERLGWARTKLRGI